MAARVAGHELAQQVGRRIARSAERVGASEVARRVEQARIIADSLAQLRGAAMKAGQLLSLDAGDFLPPEALEVLRRLQDDAQPVDFGTVREVLVEELGEEGVARLDGLSPSAAAAASIGQVHRARVDGRAVAVKVQFPGVAESIPSDLAVLRRMTEALMTVSGRRVPVEALFEELEVTLVLEADYRHEASCLSEVRQRLGSDRRFIVPEVVTELSERRVLTMDWLDGESFGAWMQRGPSRTERESVARALLDLYCREFFEWGLVQTDPNPGNFLVMDGARLGLLDFGATRRYPEDFREAYVSMLRRIGGGRDQEILSAGLDFELLDPREGEEARAAFVEMMRAATHPFSARVQPFRFQAPDYHAWTRRVVVRFLNSLRFTPPPRHLIFLHRKLGGLFNILRRLDLEMDLTPYWDRMVGTPAPTDAVQRPSESARRPAP